ncbi:MAG: 2-hydroxyacyl-CoA dehydratase [Clostridia bacterium]|nr:2-hydroxyacyl-CoA dehydratase [Clostridia bacterium]
MKKIGLTTTVPIEVLLAAGYTPIDLNNVFVTSENYLEYIEYAEHEGFPKSMCAWIKGIFGACMKNNIKEIIGVMEGDCSNTKVLVEILKKRGVTVHPFSFNHGHDIKLLNDEMKAFMAYFKVCKEDVEEKRNELNVIRKLAKEIDKKSYEAFTVSGFENHLLQLCVSDFDGDYKAYHQFLLEKLEDINQREPDKKALMLGYIGVPPMTGDIFDYVESLDAKFIYNEVQREFAFPRFDQAADMTAQYHDYTYPYDFDFRIKEIKEQIKIRDLDGIIHYTQAFCHKATEHILLKEAIDIPIINIEGDKLNVLDARTKLRLEAFIDMLHDRKEV